MTNIEYYGGVKNLRFKEKINGEYWDYQNNISKDYTINAYYKAKHSSTPIIVDTLYTTNPSKEKAKWLLAEHEFIDYKSLYSTRMKHGPRRYTW